MTRIRSRTTGRAILISHPETTGELLVVEIEIDCPQCGKVQFAVPGHHLKAIRNLLMEYIDLYPHLTGDDAGLEVIHRLQWKGTAPENPEDN